MRVRSIPLRDVYGDPVTAREQVRAMTNAHGPMDERVLDDLTVQWRAQANRALRGTGAAIVGDHIVTAKTEDSPYATPREREELQRHEANVGNIVYQTVLPPGEVTQAKLAAMDPRLSLISTIGLQR